MNELAEAYSIQRPPSGQGNDDLLDGEHPDQHPDDGRDLVGDQGPDGNAETPYAAIARNPAATVCHHCSVTVTTPA